MTITQNQLDEWRALADAATAGPWSDRWEDLVSGAAKMSFDCGGQPADSRFIAAARDAVPALLDEVKRLQMAAINLQLELDDEKRALANTERCLTETQSLRLSDASKIDDLTKQRDEWRERALAAEDPIPMCSRCLAVQMPERLRSHPPKARCKSCGFVAPVQLKVVWPADA